MCHRDTGQALHDNSSLSSSSSSFVSLETQSHSWEWVATGLPAGLKENHDRSIAPMVEGVAPCSTPRIDKSLAQGWRSRPTARLPMANGSLGLVNFPYLRGQKESCVDMVQWYSN